MAGRVTDAAGRPIPGAVVRFEYEGEEATETDSLGRFEIMMIHGPFGMPDSARVTACKAGHALARIDFAVEDTLRRHIVLTLTRTGAPPSLLCP